ncbi:MAG: peptidylprolyl isomerase [Gemmatimonadales bacterium]
MPRLGIGVLLAIIATGCGSFRDLFTSHSETVARVGSRELKSQQVADIITRLGGSNPNPQAGEAIATVWVDLQLFADRLAAGGLESDSAMFERLIWPQVAQQVVSAYHDTVVARRAQLSAAAVDSMYSGSEYRIFQHILVQPKGTAPADTARAEAEARGLLPQARQSGTNFSRLAARLSADPGSKTDSGYLQPFPKGGLVPEFEQAGWGLAPGEVSSVVKTQHGFHIIRRPLLEEVRARLQPFVQQRYVFREDSLFLADLNDRYKLEVRSGAAAAIRNAATDLVAARRSGKVLVSYQGGDFRVRDFARWLAAMPAGQLGQIQEAPDSVLASFAKNLAQNNVLLHQADSAGITLPVEVKNGIKMTYLAQINDLMKVSGLDAPELADTAKTPPAERRRIATQKINEYFDKLTNNQAQFRPMPPTLSHELRAEGDFKIYRAGVARVQELVQAKVRADSAAGAGQPQQPPAGPGLQPAPGGPPRP